jgi:SAM-dependent methyltransferase
MKLFYQIGYKYFRMPWDIGPRQELVELVESGRIKPCRTIDLGSGTASNVIFLAQHGFDVTGVDFAASAIELGRKRARRAGVKAEFVADDLTNLRHVTDTFDFLVDYGTLDDLRLGDRDLYLQNILPLTHPGSLFLLYCFEWSPSWWEWLLLQVAFFGAMALEPGEVEQRFSPYFDIEEIARGTKQRGWPRGWAVYLMTRKDSHKSNSAR